MRIPYLEITGEINNETVTKFREDYAEIVQWYSKKLKKKKIDYDVPINLFINTVGGSVDDAFAIHDIITSGLQHAGCYNLNVKKLNITTVASGCVWSAGMIIYLASERRKSYNNSSFMIHDIQLYGMSGDLVSIKQLSEYSQKQKHKMNSLFVDRANWDEEEFFQLIQKTVEFYFDVEEAKRWQLINEELH